MKQHAKEFNNLRETLGLSQRAYGLLYGFTRPQKRVSEIERGTKAVSNQVRTLALYVRELHAAGRIGVILDRFEKSAPKLGTIQGLSAERARARKRAKREKATAAK